MHILGQGRMGSAQSTAHNLPLMNPQSLRLLVSLLSGFYGQNAGLLSCFSTRKCQPWPVDPKQKGACWNTGVAWADDSIKANGSSIYNNPCWRVQRPMAIQVQLHAMQTLHSTWPSPLHPAHCFVTLMCMSVTDQSRKVTSKPLICIFMWPFSSSPLANPTRLSQLHRPQALFPTLCHTPVPIMTPIMSVYFAYVII